MKLLTIFLLALWSTAVAASASSQPRRAQTTTTSELENEEVWPTGTAVYYEYHGDWYSGTITHYFNGVYTITWVDDGQVEYFDDQDVVDQMVEAAKNNEDPTTYNVGTVVYKYFDSEKKFHHGEIVAYTNGVYQVKYSNGVVESVPAGAQIDALVQAAEDASTATAATTTVAPTTAAPMTTATEAVVRETTSTQATGGSASVAPTPEETGTVSPSEFVTSDSTVDVTMQGSFEIGTKVYKFFEGDGYYWGTISWYEDGVYTVTWQDKSKEKYDDLQEVIQMVERAARQNQGDAKESDPWENGTAVFKSFSSGDLFGEIILYQDGKYKIRWSTGDIEYYSIAQTDLMVKAAYDKVEAAKAEQTAQSSQAAQANSKKNLSGAVKFLIVVIVFVFLGLVAFFIRRLRTRKEKQAKTLEYVENDDGNLAPPPTYQDEPDASAPLSDII